MPEELNAKITSVILGPEDHGIFTAFVYLDLEDGTSQGFGGYDLRHKDAAFKFMAGVMRVAHVEEWQKLPGCAIRARREDCLIRAVGDLLKPDWFVAKEMYD